MCVCVCVLMDGSKTRCKKSFIFIFLSGRFRGRRVGETVLAARVPMAGQGPDCADGTSRVEFDDG